jgi:hypothetical protein
LSLSNELKPELKLKLKPEPEPELKPELEPELMLAAQAHARGSSSLLTLVLAARG